MMCSSIHCDHTFSSLVAAVSASAALVLLITSGLSCSFLEIRSRPDDLLVILDTDEARTFSNLGILCEGDGFYDVSEDPMQTYSLLFFIAACIAGSVSCLLAWAVSFGYSKPFFWQWISGLSAISSLVQLPMFLLFEVEVCTNYTEDQECYLDLGSYLLVASTGCWVLTTMITQCLDPPDFLEQWRATHKNNRPMTDVEVGHWRPRHHSDTQQSRSSESQHSRISQQNAPRLEQGRTTSGSQQSLVTRSLVSPDQAYAMDQSLLDQTSVATSEMDPPSINFYPAGVATEGFSQLSFHNQAKRSTLPAPHALYPSQTPIKERLASTKRFVPLHNVSSDSRSEFSDLRHSIRALQTDSESVDTGAPTLEELIARVVRKNTRSELHLVQSGESEGVVEEGKRNTSPLTLGSLDTDDDNDLYLDEGTTSRDKIHLLRTNESRKGNPTRDQTDIIERDERSEERKRQQARPNDESGVKRTKSFSTRSWDRTGMKYMRVCDDADAEPNSPPLEISINLEEGDDHLLDSIGRGKHGKFHVITPDAQELKGVNGRIGSLGVHKSWMKSISKVEPDVDGWLRGKTIAKAERNSKHHTASSASIASASSSPLVTSTQGNRMGEMNEKSFNPHVTRQSIQRSLSNPSIYNTSHVSISRPPKASEQLFGNHEKSPRESDSTSRPPKAPEHVHIHREESPHVETGTTHSERLLAQDRGNELMSEELSCHRVEHWGRANSDRTRLRSRSVPRGVIEKPHLLKDAESLDGTKSLTFSRKSNSIFRQERDDRASIHSPAVITADSGDEDDRSVVSSKSHLARKAREARLRRLAANRSSTHTRYEDAPPVVSNTQLAEKARQARVKRLMAKRSSSNSVGRGTKVNEYVNAPRSLPSSGNPYPKAKEAVINDTVEDLTLETLDVRLAEVRRPVGAEYGSEEDSV